MNENPLRRTKIVATLGPATDVPGMLERIIAEGVNVVRLNLSHGQPDDHRARANAVRAASVAAGREVGILADLQGPKIRIETFASGPVELVDGASFVLDCRPDAPPGDVGRVGVSYYGLPHDVHAGDVLLLDDGLIALSVQEVVGAEVRCTVLVGGKLSNRKGLNRQGGGLSVTALSDKDKADIKLAAEIGADFLAVSFVRSAEDMHQARRLLHEAGGNAALVAKIERADAIPVLGEIIDASDVVMVARGDLGVEIPLEQVPLLQKRAIRVAREHGKPVIVATQMLDSMIHYPHPTRAEASDVANAVYGGTDAVMLSGETANGDYPTLAASMMSRIVLEAETSPFLETAPYASRATSIGEAIARGATNTAREIGARYIVAFTESGQSAMTVSLARPSVPVIAFSPNAKARRRMALFWGVVPREMPPMNEPDALVDWCTADLMASGLASPGERVVIVFGAPIGVSGSTNSIRVHVIA